MNWQARTEEWGGLLVGLSFHVFLLLLGEMKQMNYWLAPGAGWLAADY